MTYDELMTEIIGAKPKYAEPEELMKLIDQLIRQNEELSRRIKILREWNEYYKRANVALTQENYQLKWGDK